MAKVHRRGQGPGVKKANKRHKRGCRSAPALPSRFTITYSKREVHHREEWLARAKWSPVVLDVAGRPLSVDEYEVQLRATDASGVPVDFGDSVNLTAATAASGVATFTTGPDHHFSAGDEVTVSGVTPSAYNGTWTVLAAGLTNDDFKATLGSTPAAGSAFGAVILANWDFWSHTEKAHGPNADERCVFFPLAHPKTWYFQGRLRVLNRVHGTKCWSAWTGWTTPTQPASGAIAGPPVPTGVTLDLDKVEGTKKHPWRARSKWNTSPEYTPTGGDLTKIGQYGVKLEVSHNGGTTVANIRRETVDHDSTLTTHHKNWFNIKRKRSYRTSVRAQDQYGNWGAYSSPTSWISIGGDPDDVSNVVCTNPTVGTMLTTWDLPTDLSDVDGIKVVVTRKDGGGGTVVETDYIGSHRTKYLYEIPFADRDWNHTAKVHTFEDEITLDLDTGSAGWDVATVSPGVESSEIAVNREVDIDELDITADTRRLVRPSGVPRVRLRRAATQSIPDGAGVHVIAWDTEQVDTDGFGAAGTDEVTMTFAGSYDLTSVGRFADNNTGRRTLWVQKQALGAGAWVDDVTLYSSVPSVNGDVTVPFVTNTIQVDATDKLRVRVNQFSGAALNLTDASFSAVFLGPA